MVSGKRVQPFNPDPQDIKIDDIAHSLSMQCRWNGNCKRFFSVAQHSVLVSILAEQYCPGAAAWGLMHDATEAFCGDMSRPKKRMFPLFEQGEDHAAAIIRKRFDIWFDDEIAEAVNRADYDMAFYEAEALFDDHRLTSDPVFNDVRPPGTIFDVFDNFKPSAQHHAKLTFTVRCHALGIKD
jgi:hypothetical protein